MRNQGNEVIPTPADADKDAELRRTTWYLDTPGFELQRANVTLRVRDEAGREETVQDHPQVPDAGPLHRCGLRPYA